MEAGDDPYFNALEAEIERLYTTAEKARDRNRDPAPDVEAKPAGDLADRVEGLVGPEGIGDVIREIGRENLAALIDHLIEASTATQDAQEKQIEQALRTALAIVTEGVVAAPIEGISDVAIDTNPDGSKYLTISFAGPIRSAGGTAQGLAVLAGDYIRSKLGLKEYRPTPGEVERYVEEIKLYHEYASRLQYFPTEEEIRETVKHLAVCVAGDPTEEREVSVNRDLSRIDTNRIRGGMCLVLAEGVIQKAKKIVKHAEDLGLDWDWLAHLQQKGAVTDVDEGDEDGEEADEEEEEEEEKPKGKFMSEIVGGRPIFAAASAKGAFRLRYGRSRATGIAGKAIHPAAMVLTGGFIATGTQVKVERPGKGCIMTACDGIEPPVVRLRDGEVRRVESVDDAVDCDRDIEEILFLGDVLVSYGDFLQTNTTLLPAGYCEEWWQLELEAAGGGWNKEAPPTPAEAVALSREHGIPLHPRYSYHADDLTPTELIEVVEYLATGTIEDDRLTVPRDEHGKSLLEKIGLPHRIRGDAFVINEWEPLLASLGLATEKERLSDSLREKTLAAIDACQSTNIHDLLAAVTPFPYRAKTGTYIGARMGRPEKAKERKMQPAVHALFPVGEHGGRERSVNVAAGESSLAVEVARYECPRCKNIGVSATCERCGTKSNLKRTCPRCQIVTDKDQCPRCNVDTQYFETRDIDVQKIWRAAVERVGRTVDVKGVKGMISQYKIPEPLEKGLLRAINDVYVFKDGTIRFDATDAPVTHVMPREIGVAPEKLVELGYEKDEHGVPLTRDDQCIILKAQDVVIPDRAGEYLVRVARFCDQLLAKFYGLNPYYNVDYKEDLVGHLIVGLAPHTSAGITGRIIGFTPAHVCYAHPFWHAAKRRNCDGDEDAIMLFLDTILNFSKSYLPEKRGGKMDAPLVVTTLLDPREVDDEAHKMETGGGFPLEFYEKTWEEENPNCLAVPTVQSLLACDPFAEIKPTHTTNDITGPVISSKYVTLKSMAEKVTAQLAVAQRIRAIDEREVAELVINSHFLRDTIGNMRAFTRQKVRCVKCNAKYRRMPLAGKCTACGGKLLLTVSEASVKKYLGTSQQMAAKYHLTPYLRQRLELLSLQADSLFVNDLSKQASLADYM